MPLRLCAKRGCFHKVPSGYCAEHAAAVNAERNGRVATMAERGYDNEWRAFRKATLRERLVCVVCGAPATDLDHIVELKDGGARLDPSNVQALCHSHHVRKTNDVRRSRQ